MIQPQFLFSNRIFQKTGGLLRGRLFLFLTALLLGMSACRVSSEKIEYDRGAADVLKGNDISALEHFKKVLAQHEKSPLAIQSAKEAARILHYQLKKPAESIDYYKHVILYSPSTEDRTAAQKHLADLYFTELLDYQQAIAEYSRLIELPHSSKEDFGYRLNMARSYFYLSNFFQAQVEIESILARTYERDLVFEALLLRANIFLTTKKLDDAVETLKTLMAKYPQRAKDENIGLMLAVTYEEQKNYAKAVETLQAIKDTYPRKEFVEQKIKTLKERQSYLPGAKGWKK